MYPYPYPPKVRVPPENARPGFCWHSGLASCIGYYGPRVRSTILAEASMASNPGQTERTVGPGASDLSDAPAGAPTLSAGGITVPRAAVYTGGEFVAHGDFTAATSNAPPTMDHDRDDGLPDMPRYEGPTVADQPALVNPSAGMQGADGVSPNPRGPDVYNPGDQPGGSHGNAPYPDTTVGNR